MPGEQQHSAICRRGIQILTFESGDRMKTRTPLFKVDTSNQRKPKKFTKKDRQPPKDHVETKKTHRPVQQNRFTNILDLSTLSASLMQLHDLFGTLILDFSQDPVTVKISDVTGNYELNVPKESLNEFKMKFLLGQNTKGKPTVTIFLGECQCYPELPEGALELSENHCDDTASQIDSVFDESKIEAKVDVGVGSDIVEDTAVNSPADAEDEAKDILEPDELVAPLFALFEENKVEPAQPCKKKNVVTYETHHISISESQKLEPLSNSDELIVKVRPRKISTKLRKTQSQKKPNGAKSEHARRSSKNAYKSNLEGFVKFLMTDKVCGVLLDKMKTPDNAAKLGKQMSGQKVVNYSDGQEFRVCFSEDPDVEVKPNGSAGQNDRHSDSLETERCPSMDDKPTDGIKVLFERSKPFVKTAFVEQVKKEIEEWQAKGEKTVNVEIIEDAKSSSTTEDSDSNIVTVYEDPKTTKNCPSVTTDFDDVTSYGFSEDVANPTEKVFSLDLKDKETAEVVEDAANAVAEGKFEFESLDVKSDRTHDRVEEYVAPINLASVSTAEIEAMWMNFVEKFHQSTESARKLGSSCQVEVDPSNLPETKSNEVEQSIKSESNLSGSAYPGQHYLPYFVEESLRRVNLALGNWCSSNSFSNVITNKPEVLPRPSQMGPFALFNESCNAIPKHFDVPKGPPFHRHPTFPSKFSTKKSRIFFNPHVSVVDWY